MASSWTKCLMTIHVPGPRSYIHSCFHSLVWGFFYWKFRSLAARQAAVPVSQPCTSSVVLLDFTKLKSCCSHSPAGPVWNAVWQCLGRRRGRKQNHKVWRGDDPHDPLLAHAQYALQPRCVPGLCSGAWHQLQCGVVNSFLLPERGQRHRAINLRDFWALAWHFWFWLAFFALTSISSVLKRRKHI